MSHDQQRSLAAAIDRSFKMLTIALLVLAGLWLASGVRSVKAGEQAVHLRWGTVIHVHHQPGLVLALPAPFDEVIIVPAPDRQLSLALTDFSFTGGWQAQADKKVLATGNDDDVQGASGPVVDLIKGAKSGLDPRQDGGYIMTADHALIHLDATVLYHSSDAVAYALAHHDKEQYLRRVFCQSAIQVCSRHTVDELRSTSLGFAKAQVAQLMNQALVDQGLQVQRVDLTIALPERAKFAFDLAQRAIAEASTVVAQAQAKARRIQQNALNTSSAVHYDSEAIADELITLATQRAKPVLAEMSAVAHDRDQQLLLRQRRYRTALDVLLPKLEDVHVLPVGGSVRLDLGN